MGTNCKGDAFCLRESRKVMDLQILLQFCGYFILFVVGVFTFWFLPGIILINAIKVRAEVLTKLVLSIAIGIVLHGLFLYVTGYLNLRFLSYGYLVCAFAYLLKKKKYLKTAGLSVARAIWGLNKSLLVLLLVGMFLQSIQMWGTGLLSSFGMGFFRVHMQDGIYHLSMIQSMVRSFPPMEPGANGILVTNYHYWSDLVFSDFVRILGIPANHLFFQFLPPLISFMTGLGIICVLRLFTKRTSVFVFALFLNYFGADLGYLVAWLIHGQFSFEYPVIDNGATQFLNMPHAVAKLLFFAGIIPLQLWMKEAKWKWGLLTVLIAVVLFGIKVYFALFFALGLFLLGILAFVKFAWSWAKRRENSTSDASLFRQFLLFGVVGAVLALFIYLPPNRGSGGLTYVPLEWPKLMLAEGNLDWRDWRYKRAVAEIENLKAKQVYYDILAVLITLLAIHGVRIVGFIVTKQTYKELGKETILFLLAPSLIFTFLGLYTLQVSGNFNVFNFFAMSLAPLTILSAFFYSSLWRVKYFGPVLVSFLVISTMPRIIFETQKIITSYRDRTDVLYISGGEITALKSIDNDYPASCVVASSLNNLEDMNTPYVSYFSNRPAYMSGQRVLETHNAPTVERYNNFRKIFAGNDAGRIEQELRAKGVCALYLKTEDGLTKYFSLHSKLSFSNDEALVVDLR